ncbi:QRFP-like peptide receptor [Branchiostoma floridae x Branchiostoma japonicum]
MDNVSYSVISAIGILANLLVLYIVVRYPAMRTVCNVYVAKLAATDFAFCLYTLIQSIVSNSETYDGICDVGRVLLVFLVCASIMFLIVIAVERYKAITDPLRSRQHGTVKHAGKISAVVWMVASLAAAVDTVARNTVTNDWTFTGTSLYHNSCIFLKLESSDASHPFFVMALLCFLFLYVLPICIIVPLYVRILVRVRQSRRLVVRETRSDNQAFLMMFVVTVFFLVTWLPYHVISFIIHRVVSRENDVVIELAKSLAVLNSMANPFLYALLGRNFRDQLKKMFCCKQWENRKHWRPKSEASTDMTLTRRVVEATEYAIGQAQGTGRTGQGQATDGTARTQATGGKERTQATGVTGQSQATSGTRQGQTTGGTGQSQATGGTGQSQATGETEQSQATGGTGQSQATGGTEQSQATDGTEMTQVTDGTERTQAAGGTQRAQATDGTETTQAAGGTERTQATDGTERTQASGWTERTQATGGTERTQATDGIERTQDAGGTERTQAGQDRLQAG